MKNQFIFEAGSTKTTVLMRHPIVDGAASIEHGEDTIYEVTLSGFNPNRPATSFESELESLPIQVDDQVCFYGSGLHAAENKKKVEALFSRLFQCEITVFDDVLGAARSSYRYESGVIAIMGTGGIVAYFDGNEILHMKGGYGYLIDDLGGGYELGKVIVSTWLNRELPAQFSAAIQALLGVNREEFIHYYYGQPNLGSQADGLKLISSTVPLAVRFMNDPEVKKMLRNYFELFFKRHVLPLCEESATKKIRLTGSIASKFEELLREMMSKWGYQLKGVVRYPAIELWDFHFRKQDHISL